jgi:hypothetical protein
VATLGARSHSGHDALANSGMARVLMALLRIVAAGVKSAMGERKHLVRVLTSQQG